MSVPSTAPKSGSPRNDPRGVDFTLSETDRLCFTCPLTDCDDLSPRCLIQIAKRRHYKRVTPRRICKRGHAVTPENSYYGQCVECRKIRDQNRQARRRAARDRQPYVTGDACH